MLSIQYYPVELAFEYPFTLSKGTRTTQSCLIIELSAGRFTGLGETTVIPYYGITMEGLVGSLEKNKTTISRYALTEPERFWHFLEHQLPGQSFLISALDIAAWDLFSKMRQQPLFHVLGLKPEHPPVTDYTIGIDNAQHMVKKMHSHPAHVYKIKIGHPDDIDRVIALRRETEKPFRIDANGSLDFDAARRLLPEFVRLNVELFEQPLAKDAAEEMKELKQKSTIPLFADESCVTETDVSLCAPGFHGVNIKFSKCGGITPALRMIRDARQRGMKVMLGSMTEGMIGSAAIAHLASLADFIDADGPLLLKETVTEGLVYKNGQIRFRSAPGLGVRYLGEKRVVAQTDQIDPGNEEFTLLPNH